MKHLGKTPNQRLQWILSDINITPYKFSKDLEYKTPDIIYNIINDKNNINKNLLNRIELSKHPINIEWIKTGFGDPLNRKLDKGGYGNELGHNYIIIYPNRLDFNFLKNFAENFAVALNIESDSYSVEVRTANIVGLEFKFTIYSEVKDIVIKDKYYSLTLNPDWNISNFFDFWRVREESMRCQNLLELYRNIPQKFENAIYPIIERLKILIESTNNDEILFDDIYLKDTLNFKMLYKTDERID